MKKMLAAMVAALLMVSLTASVALADKPSTDLMGQAWRVYNAMPATSSFWDIEKVKLDMAGDLTFPIQPFETKTTGSFAVYLQNNYNTSLTDSTTLSATASWTHGTYETRSTVFSGAYGRFWFQDVTSGHYTSNDYWWYSGSSFDLNGSTTGTVTAALSDRAHWSNICGQVATDMTAHPGLNCVGGTDPAVSPYDGFTNAMKNVKQLGLSFGSAGSYASGVAFDGDTGSFSVSSFTVAP
jgi:hypothetical protein